MPNSILLLRPYCEAMLHTGIEPLNALSNIGFVLVGLYILRNNKAGELRAVGMLTFLLGIGSLVWHSARSVPTYYADIVPLACLQLLISILIFRKFHAFAPIVGLTCIGIAYYILENFFALADPGCSELYFSIIIVLFGLVLLHYVKRKPRATLLLVIALIFSAGYGIRQLDLFLCNSSIFYYGTHWIWHLICAASIYFAVQYIKE